MTFDPYNDDSDRDTVFVPSSGSPARPRGEDSFAHDSDRADSLIGDKLEDKYQILDRIGTGGMAVVYKAIQLSIGRSVAVKTMQMSLSLEPVLVQRFQREMNSLGKLNHPNIVSIFDSGQTASGQLYLVMDYLGGPTLQSILERNGAMPLERAQHIFIQIADALNHAHKRDVIHRDLKPGNIILEKDDRGQDVVKVVDFGLAKIEEGAERLTRAGEIWGSALYMSPEQCGGEDVDARADIYSFGIIMYQTLTGSVPFRGKTFMDTVGKHVNEPPPPFSQINPSVSVPDMVEHVIMRCLEKSPDNRFSSVADLKSALLAVLPAHSITARERPYNFSDASSQRPTRRPATSTRHNKPVRSEDNKKRSFNPVQMLLLTLLFLALTAAGIGAASLVLPKRMPLLGAPQKGPANTDVKPESNAQPDRSTSKPPPSAPAKPPQRSTGAVTPQAVSSKTRKSSVRSSPAPAKSVQSSDVTGKSTRRKQRDEYDIIYGDDMGRRRRRHLDN